VAIAASVGGLSSADTNQDEQLDMDEVIAYAMAWKHGDLWPAPPEDIPQNYVTNGGYIWKSGEQYHYDSQQTSPTCWIPDTVQFLSPKVRLADVTNQTGVRRVLPKSFAAGQTVSVRLEASPPPGTRVWTVEDTVPKGWQVVNVQGGGAWLPNMGKIRWGMFLDGQAQTLPMRSAPGRSRGGGSVRRERQFRRPYRSCGW